MTPITEVVMTMDKKYEERVKHYLEHEFRCRVTSIGQSRYLIQFPQGTTEWQQPGQSTRGTHRTTIRFLSGRSLDKTTFSSINPKHPSFVTLYFPLSVLEGPEPRRVYATSDK